MTTGLQRMHSAMTSPSAEGAPTLEALAGRAATGDESAFTALVTATIDELRLFVAVRLACMDAVEEVVQATYIACWQSLDSYRVEQSFMLWLRGIARHRLARMAREQQRDRRRRGGDQFDAREVPAPDDAADGAAGLEALAALRRCLATVSADARAMLEAYYRHGQALADIGTQRQRRPGAVAATLHRTRQILRQCLERQGVQWCSVGLPQAMADEP